jgi:hypothetical protein
MLENAEGNLDQGRLICIEEDVVFSMKETHRKSVGNSQKAVEQLDLITEEVVHRYTSASEAAILMCADQSTLAVVCKGRGKSAYNFKWRFYTGPLLGMPYF